MPDDPEFAPQDRPDAPSDGSLVPSPPPLAGDGHAGRRTQRPSPPLGHKRHVIYAYYTFFVYFTCWRGVSALAKSQIKK